MGFIRTVYQLGFEISPIILVNGIASLIGGQMLPIVALTDALSFTFGLFSGANVTDLDDFFAHWKPLPGSTLISQQIGTYPFANQAVAANAVIAQPLQISMSMTCPAQNQTSYPLKLAIIEMLQGTLAQHNASGGTYTVATPAFIYTNCLLTKVTDISGGESKQVQYVYQFDFVQPLITTTQAQQVYGTLMNQIAGGLPTSASPTVSGIGSTINSNLAGSASSVFPVSSNLIGSTASGVASGASAGIAGGGL
jgi:hypothetical protein